MAAREYMIEYRKSLRKDIREMAAVCNVSTTLLSMLENNDREVTHPKIAETIGKKYHLTKKQIEGMKPENYRKGSPEYNPNKYRAMPDMIQEE